MADLRDQLVKLDADLGRAWAKIEILLGLLAASAGQFLGIWQLTGGKGELNLLLVLAGMALIVFGGYLTLAGHRSHLSGGTIVIPSRSLTTFADCGAGNDRQAAENQRSVPDGRGWRTDRERTSAGPKPRPEPPS